jgi:hypothetical protein
VLPLEAFKALVDSSASERKSSKMKPVDHEKIAKALETLLAVKPETVTQRLARVLGPNAEPVADTTVCQIVDITEQFIGKAIIITGAKKPKE